MLATLRGMAEFQKELRVSVFRFYLWKKVSEVSGKKRIKNLLFQEVHVGSRTEG